MRIILPALALAAALTAQDWPVSGQAAQSARLATISEADMKEWLTYLASDALQGRASFTEGYGLAASFVAEQLRSVGVKPLGDNGTYFQEVTRRGYRVTRNSSVTVDVGGRSRTFRHGDHVTMPVSGGRRTLTVDAVEFVGYGQVNLTANYDDFRGRNVKGRLVVGLSGMPAVLTQQAEAAGRGGRGGRGGNFAGRGSYIIQTLGAGAVASFQPTPAPPSAEELAAQAALDKANQAVIDAQAQLQQARAAASGRAGRGGGGGAGRGARGRGAAAPQADVNTTQNVEAIAPPQFTGDETFFEFLFSGSPVTFADLRAKAAAGEPLAPFTLANVKVTVNIDNAYDVLTTERTKNVVGLVEGSDPQLRSTYVFFGAHLDHVGYRQSPGGGRGGGAAAATGAGTPDLISNGADDDGSGSTALLGLAKAFATGPKPRRSVVFVWHAAEESGLLGSRYMADFPVVPIDRIQAQFNMDMIGRNRDDDPAYANTVFVIGADRISTELHNVVVDTNASLPRPLTLDYEYNDPSDSNNFYTRSDHYSYAAKGIPIAFFFTGTHPDYHGVGDHPDKILYPKLTGIAQLVYQAGYAVANNPKPLNRDNRGPRSGRGFSGRIDK
jgi:hypothetical protein